MDWIYPKDKLPEDGDVVLAWSLDADEAFIVGYDDGEWMLEDGYDTPVEVLAWMPLPYKPK